MKLFFLIGMLSVGAICLLPRQKNIEGTWVLDVKGKTQEQAILRIELGDGFYTAKLDMPGQLVFDKPVTIQMETDSVKILLDEKADCFIVAASGDSTMVGRSVVDGKAETVKFNRLAN
jgi:hypothetical protein